MINVQEAVSEAESLLEAAEKAESKLFGFFKTGTNYEKKIDLLERAASKFLMGQQAGRAGQVYVTIAQLQIQLEEPHEAANNFKKAAEYLKSVDFNKCIECYNQAINIRASNNGLDQAARMYQDLADVYKEKEMYKEALQAYGNALKYLEPKATSKNAANSTRLKMAELCLDAEDYVQAEQLYLSCGKFCAETSILRFSSKNHIFRSILCAFIIDKTAACEKQVKYFNDFHEYKNSQEAKLMNTLVASVQENDGALFIKKLDDFNTISNPDRYIVKLLTKIKKAVESDGGEDDIT